MAKPSAPTYILWHEAEFVADRVAARMTPHQRLMYRALCQVARFCDTRPYLPDDDDELFILADADSLEQWKVNRDAVLAKFTKLSIAGKPMLAHKRVVSDHEDYAAYIEQARLSGAKGGRGQGKGTLRVPSADPQQSNEVMNNTPEPKPELPLLLKDQYPVSNTLSTSVKPLPKESSAPDGPLPPPPTAHELNPHEVDLIRLFEQKLADTYPLRKNKKKIDINRPEHWQHTWSRDFSRLRVTGYSEAEIARMIEYAFSSRWFTFTYRPKNIVDNYDKLAKDLKLPIHSLAPEPQKRELPPETHDASSMVRKYKAEAEKEKDEFDWDNINDKLL